VGGLILEQRAPMSAKRLKAAGPGKLSAKLKMRTPLNVLSCGMLA